MSSLPQGAHPLVGENLVLGLWTDRIQPATSYKITPPIRYIPYKYLSFLFTTLIIDPPKSIIDNQHNSHDPDPCASQPHHQQTPHRKENQSNCDADSNREYLYLGHHFTKTLSGIVYPLEIVFSKYPTLKTGGVHIFVSLPIKG